jgi:C4-dicarboxylate-specific signal transduction histidine kinase
VTVSAQLTAGLSAVLGDRVGLQQVLLNLIVNACDAMKLNEPARRRLTVTTGPDGEGAVRVAITDRGGGIPADSLARVFEPFYTTKEHGLGLGLAICRSIVEAHGGRLWVTNNSDHGATFCFALDVASSERAGARDAASSRNSADR